MLGYAKEFMIIEKFRLSLNCQSFVFANLFSNLLHSEENSVNLIEGSLRIVTEGMLSIMNWNAILSGSCFRHIFIYNY